MSIVLTMLLIGLLLVGAGLACERAVERRPVIYFQGPACALLTGWAVLCLIGVFSALTGVPLTLPVIALGAAGIVGYVLAGAASAGLARLALAWLLLLPLMAIASVIPPTMADEFPALLPNAKILVAADVFPDQARPNVWTSKPEYPPALPLIGYAAARWGWVDVAYPAKIFNVMLAGAFALALAEPFVRRIGTLAAIAFGVALASVLNPFFDPRIALSAHTDVATGFVLALCVGTAWRAIWEQQPRWPLHAAAAAIVLVLLRETNIMFVVALAAGLLVLSQRKLASMICVPALAAFGLWRLYILIAGWPSSMTARAFAEWDWSAPFTMLRALFGDRLANNPVLGVAGTLIAIVVIYLFIRSIRSGDKMLRALFVLTAIVSAAWITFLAWAYATVFSDDVVMPGNSAWRYLSQLGPLLIFAIVVAVAQALPARAEISRIRMAFVVGVVACIAVLLFPLATSAHWRIDCRYPDVVVVRHATQAIGNLVGGERIAVVHPRDASLHNEIVDYELGRPVRSSPGYKTVQEVPPGGFRLDLTELDRDRLIRNGVVPKIELARWEGVWKPVLTLVPEKPRPCGATTFERWEFTQRSG